MAALAKKNQQAALDAIIVNIFSTYLYKINNTKEIKPITMASEFRDSNIARPIKLSIEKIIKASKEETAPLASGL